jgi:hypothetical protein
MANPLISTMLNNLLEREGREAGKNTSSNNCSHPVRLNTKQEHSLREIFLNHNCKTQNSKKSQDVSTVNFQNLDSLVSKEKVQRSTVSKTNINLCTLEDLTPKR